MWCSLSPKDTSVIRTEFFLAEGLSLLEEDYCIEPVLCVSSKAQRCYNKAYELDTENEEAGAALVDLLMDSSQEVRLLAGR